MTPKTLSDLVLPCWSLFAKLIFSLFLFCRTTWTCFEPCSAGLMLVFTQQDSFTLVFSQTVNWNNTATKLRNYLLSGIGSMPPCLLMVWSEEEEQWNRRGNLLVLSETLMWLLLVCTCHLRESWKAFSVKTHVCKLVMQCTSNLWSK